VVSRCYSQTTWTVRPGSEEEFVRRWTEVADWSASEGLRTEMRLVRDVDDPSVFVSVGPWESVAAIAAWRTLPGFQERVAALAKVVERFDVRTLELVADHG